MKPSSLIRRLLAQTEEEDDGEDNLGDEKHKHQST